MPPITPGLVLFATAAGLLCLTSVGVVALRNTVRSALCLVLTFFLLAFFYFSLGFEMLGITQIVVYTGAIMVLFLFVVMVLNVGEGSLMQEKFDWRKPVGIGLGLLIAGGLAAVVLPNFMGTTPPPAIPGFGTPPALGRSIFTDYVFPFEAVSILLLIGVVGSILLAKRRLDR
ncbi:MAG: NADH-quinone oxidoreductase subunit J [Armatimonadota bacterium]